MSVAVDLGRRLAEEARGRAINAKVFGGAGIELRVGTRPLGLDRPIEDVDLVVEAKHGPRLEKLLREMDLVGDLRCNALNGDRRQIHWAGEIKVDVFVGVPSLCHQLDFSGHLAHEHPALTAPDLLLTKLQIVELTEKDAKDVFSLISTHETRGDGPGVIDASRVAQFTSADWGLVHDGARQPRHSRASSPGMAS
jgi:hypothetical protein